MINAVNKGDIVVVFTLFMNRRYVCFIDFNGYVTVASANVRNSYFMITEPKICASFANVYSFILMFVNYFIVVVWIMQLVW